MKITIYDLLGMVKDGKAPKNARIRYFDRNNDYYDECNLKENEIINRLHFGNIELNDKVEILENTNEITAEQMMMATDTLNKLKPTAIEAAKNWNKMAEAIKNNFNILEEKKKLPEKEKIYKIDVDLPYESLIVWQQANNKIFERQINALIDYFESKGDK